jgi:hypothetical protein
MRRAKRGYFTHGTAAGYNKGCTCEACTAANTARHAKYMAKYVNGRQKQIQAAKKWKA